jgi:anti-sigma B factor antagonist
MDRPSRQQSALPETPFVIDLERRGPMSVVRLRGSCTMNDSGRLTECMVKLASEAVPVIVLDMAGLDFIESSGLGAIIAGHLRCRHHKGEVRLAAPPPVIRHILDITRLSQLFNVYDSVDQATTHPRGNA